MSLAVPLPKAKEPAAKREMPVSAFHCKVMLDFKFAKELVIVRQGIVAISKNNSAEALNIVWVVVPINAPCAGGVGVPNQIPENPVVAVTPISRATALLVHNYVVR